MYMYYKRCCRAHDKLWRAAGPTPMFENIVIFRAAVTDRLKRITSEVVYCVQKTKSQGMSDNCNS
jgi:hypothetical protein